MPTQKYARMGDHNNVIETWQPPENLAYLTPAMVFVPSLAVDFVPCPDFVVADAIYNPDTDTWTNPPPPPPPPEEP